MYPSTVVIPPLSGNLKLLDERNGLKHAVIADLVRMIDQPGTEQARIDRLLTLGRIDRIYFYAYCALPSLES